MSTFQIIFYFISTPTGRSPKLLEWPRKESDSYFLWTLWWNPIARLSRTTMLQYVDCLPQWYGYIDHIFIYFLGERIRRKLGLQRKVLNIRTGFKRWCGVTLHEGEWSILNEMDSNCVSHQLINPLRIWCSLNGLKWSIYFVNFFPKRLGGFFWDSCGEDHWSYSTSGTRHHATFRVGNLILS